MDNKSTGLRSSIVDLWRFLSCFFIMASHLFWVKYSEPYPWKIAWVYVDFFFLLTGYYTYKHFRVHQTDNKGSAAFWYTVKKYARFLPYTVPAIVVLYFIDGIGRFSDGMSSFIGNFIDMPIELMFLLDGPRNKPLWFLNALFIVFPLFSLFVQIKDHYIICILSFFISVYYYNYYACYYIFEGAEHIEMTGALFRAFAGMALGAFIGSLIDIINKKIKSPPSTLTVTVIESVALVVPVVITLFNWTEAARMIMILFLVGAFFMLSGWSYTAHLHSRWISFLGELSLPMFVWHFVVESIIRQLLPPPMPDWIRVMVFILGTFVVSIVNYGVAKKIRILTFSKIEGINR